MGELVHNQCILLVVMIAMYFPFWSYMLDSKRCICTVGIFVRIYFLGLHSCMDIMGLMSFKGGCMNIGCPLFGCG